MAWWVDEANLSQVQLNIINNAVEQIKRTSSGAKVWVQGCAGTGKTLVLTHIARRLQGQNEDYKIIFLTYTHALKKMIKETVREAGVQADVDTYLSFLYRSKGDYDVIVLDEVQDVKLIHLKQLEQRCRHFIVAGDCEQRIYESSNTESAIDSVINFEKSRLIELFRITRYIVKIAQKIMPWTKLTEGDGSKIKRDVSIAVRQFNKDEEREAHWVYSEALAFARPGRPSAILLPNHNCIYLFCLNLSRALGVSSTGPKIDIQNQRINNYDILNSYFNFHNLPLQYLGGQSGDISVGNTKPFVYILTYHSSKGLDFDHVFLPMMNFDLKIGHSISRNDDMEYARTLFFVAITRSRERLILSYSSDEPFTFINEMPKEVVAFTKDGPDEMDDDNDDSEFF